MEHTPGDWMVWGGTTFGHPDNRYNFGVQNSKGVAIARMFGPKGIRGCTANAPPQEEVEGNAHLMAAALAMKEKLQGIGLMAEILTDEEFANNRSNIHSEIVTLLAQAEGKDLPNAHQTAKP